jgi:hypothetical protein
MRTAENRPQDIEREIERTRGEMSGTLHEIQRRLSPERLLDDGLRYLRQGGPARFTANLGETAVREPVPLALIGVGVAWLMFSSYRGNGRYSRSVTEYAPDHQEPTVWDKASGTWDRASEAWDKATGKASEAAAKISDSAAAARSQVASFADTTRELAHTTREEARHYSQTAQLQARRVRERTREIVEEQPLVLGVLGLAIGAALGAFAPSTRREDELMGEKRDELLNAAKQAFSEVKSGIAAAAQSVGEPVSSESRAQSTEGSAPNSGMQSAREHASPNVEVSR